MNITNIYVYVKTCAEKKHTVKYGIFFLIVHSFFSSLTCLTFRAFASHHAIIQLCCFHTQFNLPYFAMRSKSIVIRKIFGNLNSICTKDTTKQVIDCWFTDMCSGVSFSALISTHSRHNSCAFQYISYLYRNKSATIHRELGCIVCVYIIRNHLIRHILRCIVVILTNSEKN